MSVRNNEFLLDLYEIDNASVPHLQAEALRDAIHKEYINSGSFCAVKDWYIDSLTKAIPSLASRCVMFMDAANENERISSGVYDMVSKAVPTYPLRGRPQIWLNEKLYGPRGIAGLVCPISGKRAGFIFRFRPNDWKDIEIFTGETPPKIVMGWERDRAPNLVGTPFEPTEARRPRYRNASPTGSGTYFDFSFVIGFSAAGLNLCREEVMIGDK